MFRLRTARHDAGLAVLKRLCGVALLACTLGAPFTAFAAAVGSPPRVDQRDRRALIELERRWNDAIVRRDIRLLEHIIGDDFLLVWVDGSKTRKAELLKAVAARKADIDPFVTRGVEARFFGDVAVVTGEFTQTVRLGDRWETNDFAYTDVYRRRGGGWQAVSAQATRLRRVGGSKE